MRIAILCPSYLAKHPSGSEIASKMVAKELSKIGYEVHIIAYYANPISKEDYSERFYIHEIKVPLLPIIGNLIYALGSLIEAKKINPDIVQSISISFFSAGLPAFLIKKFLKIPFVGWGQGSDVYLSGFNKLFRKEILENADIAVALTEDMKRSMEKICNMPVKIVPNGVEFDKFCSSSLSKEEARLRLHIDKTDKVLIFIGRLIPIKGLLFLIDAMGILSHEYPDIKLLILGNGKDKANLINKAEDLNIKNNIIFADYVPNELLPIYLICSDIFVLPSLSEGFPLVLLEAMASGLPIVATRINGNAEIVKDGVNGFLVEPMNSEDIAEKVSLLLNDKNLMINMSKNNIEKARLYSWNNIAKMLGEIYSKTISKRRSLCD